MAQTNIVVPKVLPPMTFVVDKAVEFFNTPQSILDGLSLSELFPPGLTPDHCWMTGSRIWSLAVKGEEAPVTKDIDLIFSTKEFADKFGRWAYGKLCKKTGEAFYSLSENSFGGIKISNAMLGSTIMDVWGLEDGQSIAEHISGFRYGHERVAVWGGAKFTEFGALTRLINPEEFGSRKHDKLIIDAERSKRRQIDYGS